MNQIDKNIENKSEITKFIKEKTKKIQEIIRNTIISIKKNTHNEIFSNTDANLSITVLNDIYIKSKEIINIINNKNSIIDSDKLIDLLQKIIDKLSMLICGFGTKKIEDLLFICFGSEFINMKITDQKMKSKWSFL